MRTILFLLVLIFSMNAFAFESEKILSDPAKEQEAQRVFTELKCVVCTSQSLAESNAGLAVDIRKLVRNEIEKGKNKDEIIDFLVSRYGEEILLKPPVKNYTYALWFLPFLLLASGFAFIGFYTRKR